MDSTFSTNIELQNATFSNNSASYGQGGLFFQRGGANTLILSQASNITQTTAYLDGGIAYLKGSGIQLATVNGANLIRGISQYGKGGLAYLSGTEAQVQIINGSVVNNCQANQEGGVAYFETTNTKSIFQITSARVTNSKSFSDGGIAAINGISSELNLNSALISSSQSYGNGGAFYSSCQNFSSNIIQSYLVERCYSFNDASLNSRSLTGGKGGFLYLESKYSQININNSTIRDMNANLSGGVIHQKSNTGNSSFTVTNSTIINFQATDSGSFYHIQDTSTGLLNMNFQISNIKCLSQGIWSSQQNYNGVTQSLDYGDGDRAGAIYIDQSIQGNIRSNSNNYQNCYTTNEGAIFSLYQGTSLIDDQSNFNDNAGKKGQIYCKSCILKFFKTNFKDNLGQYGSILHLVDSSNVYFNDTQMSYGNAINQGGAIYATGSGPALIQFLNCSKNYEYFQSKNDGGFMYINQPDLIIRSTNCGWDNLYAGGEGALIYGGQISNLQLDQCNIVNISSQSGGAMISSQQPGFQFTLSNCIISCRNNFSVDTVTSELSTNAQLKSSLFTFYEALNITSLSNTFKFCYTTLQGGVFNLNNTQYFYDNNSIFEKNAAKSGGAFIITNVTNATFHKTQFIDNYANFGGSVYATGENNINYDQITIISSISNNKGGFMSIYETSPDNANTIKFTLSQLYGSQSLQGSGGLLHIDAENTVVEIIDTLIHHSYAYQRGGVIFIAHSGFINIQNVTTQNCSSKNSSGSIIYSESQTAIFQINQSYIQCSTQLSQISIANIQNNAAQMGGAFYIEESINGVEVRDSMIRNCFVGDVGGAFFIKNSPLTVIGTSSFSNNAAIKGGAIYCDSCLLWLNQTIIDGNKAAEGGAIYIIGKSTINLVEVQFLNSQATSSGGVIYSEQSYLSSDPSMINFYGINQIINSKAQQGGSFYINNEFLSINLNDTGSISIENSQATNGSGGVFFIDNGLNLQIKDCSFKNVNSSQSGSFLYSISSNLNLSIENSSVQCSLIDISANIDSIKSNSINSISSIGGAFYIDSTQISVTSLNNSVRNCYLGDQGGAFSIKNATLKDTNSIYQNNAAIKGGAIYCEKCTLDLQNIQFSDNYARSGGTFYIKDYNQDFSSQNFEVLNSYASSSGGTFYLEGNQTYQFSITNTIKVRNSSASQKGGLLYANNKLVDINFQQVNFTTFQSNGSGGVFYFDEIRAVTLQQNAFYHFKADAGSFLFSQSSTLDLNLLGNTFNCLDPTSQDITSYLIDDQATVGDRGGAFHIINSTKINSFNNLFTQCQNCHKGGIFYLENSIMTEEQSEFTNNAALQGGVFFLKKSDLSLDKSIFELNYAQQGGIFYIQGLSPVVVKNVLLDQSQAIYGGVAYIQDQVSENGKFDFDLQFSNITNSQALKSGGAFYVNSQQLKLLKIHQCYFDEINSQEGGGIFYVQKMTGSIVISSKIPNEKTIFRDFYTPKEYLGSLLYAADSKFSLEISDTLVECSPSFDQLFVTHNILESQNAEIAGAFYIQDSESGVTSQSNEFRNCYKTKEGAIFTLLDTKMTDFYSNFHDNAAETGGVIQCISCRMTLKYNQFHNNQAYRCGVASFLNDAFLTAESVMIQDNLAKIEGGVICLVQTKIGVLQSSTIQFENCNILKNNSADFGGFGFLMNKYAQLKFIKSEVMLNEGKQRAGLLDVMDADEITFDQSIIKDMKSKDSLMIYSEAQTLYLNLLNSQITCNSTYSIAEAQRHLDIPIQPISQTTTNFQIRQAQKITSFKNTFQYCGISKYGGVFHLSDSNLEDESSVFVDNSGSYGGIILAEKSNVQLLSTVIKNNLANIGGVIHMSSESYLNATRVLFQTNKAFSSAGVIYIQTESYADILECDFIQNQANDSSVMEVLGGSKRFNISVTSSRLQDNRATSNTMSLMYAKVFIEDTDFQNNEASKRSKNIFTGFSTITLKKCFFTQTQVTNQIQALSDSEISGAYAYAILNVGMDILSSTFTNGLSIRGGAIYISGDAQVNIINSDFRDNYAKIQGGAIYGDSFKNITVMYSKFNKNIALEKGDEFYLSNTEGLFFMQQVNISNPLAQSSIYADNINLKFEKVFIKNISTQSKSATMGSGLICYNCRSIFIRNSYFNQGISKLGGLVYIEETTQNKKEDNRLGKYQIRNSTFQNGQAFAGGALYLLNVQYLLIQNSSFINNIAQNTTLKDNYPQYGSGGAIFTICDSQTLDCELNINNRTIFQDNKAQRKGGAIHWDTVEPIMTDNLLFQGNQASQYGDNISCFAQKLSVVSEDQYYQALEKVGIYNQKRYLGKHLQANSEQTDSSIVSLSLNNTRSGSEIPAVLLALVDKYSQIVTTDSNSKVRVIVNSSQSNSPYPPIIEGSSQFEVIGGVVQIKDIIFTATPGQAYNLVFSTDGIDKNKQSNKQYMDTIKTQDIDFKVQVGLRECEVGEQFTVVGKCQSCPEGQSFSLVKMTAPGTCQKCPTEKAVCNGNSNIGPKPGYWRSSNSSSNFIKCLNQNACLGMIPPENDPIGTCAEGYQGILCSDCKNGYSRTDDYKCSECPEITVNIIRLFCIFAVVCGMIVWMIKSTLDGAKQTRNVTSIYLKIMLNHVQLLLLTAAFQFKWPDQVTQFFDITKPVAQASTQAFSIDCFLEQQGEKVGISTDSNAEGVRIFFVKELMYAVLPFLLIILSYGFWLIYKRIKKLQQSIMSEAVSTLIILLFFVHPNIVQFMFNNFNCYKVDAVWRIQQDMEVICWSKTHYFFSYAVALPSIFAWGLGIPAFAFVMLFRNRKKLFEIETKEKFGFLYNGYRKEFYYWEIVIMYRKITLIFISVFVINFGLVAQALIVFMLLLFFLLISTKKKPFNTVPLNDLEVLSLITSSISIYCAIFYISDVPDEWLEINPEQADGALQLSDGTKLFLFIMIVVTNVVFFVYWCFKMYYEMKNKFMQQLPSIYLFLCQCMNERKFKNELKAIQIANENEMLRDELVRQLRSIKDLYNRGHLVLNQNSLERVCTYLRAENILRVAGYQEKDYQFNPRGMKRLDKVNKDKDISELAKYQSQDSNVRIKASDEKTLSFLYNEEQKTQNQSKFLKLDEDLFIDDENQKVKLNLRIPKQIRKIQSANTGLGFSSQKQSLTRGDFSVNDSSDLIINEGLPATNNNDTTNNSMLGKDYDSFDDYDPKFDDYQFYQQEQTKIEEEVDEFTQQDQIQQLERARYKDNIQIYSRKKRSNLVVKRQQKPLEISHFKTLIMNKEESHLKKNQTTKIKSNKYPKQRKTQTINPMNKQPKKLEVLIDEEIIQDTKIESYRSENQNEQNQIKENDIQDQWSQQ